MYYGLLTVINAINGLECSVFFVFLNNICRDRRSCGRCPLGKKSKNQPEAAFDCFETKLAGVDAHTTTGVAERIIALTKLTALKIKSDAVAKLDGTYQVTAPHAHARPQGRAARCCCR